jgi:hypothetical protein
LTVGGKRISVVLGDRVVVGRSPGEAALDSGVGSIRVPSDALSRCHLELGRAAGQPAARDLDSRNGTFFREMRLVGETLVGERLELRLGGEVPVVVTPTEDLPDAVAIEVAGLRYVAPLGPARLGLGRWRLERGGDGWVELVTEDDPPAFDGALRLASRITLLRGDALAAERRGKPHLVIER